MDMSYGRFVELVGILHSKLARERLHKPRIYGVSRGGLVPAVYLSHLMDAPMDPLHRDMMPARRDGHSVIIVDDMVDTGNTYRELHSYATHYAVLLSRIRLPGIVYGEFYDGGWVRFPWEVSKR